jgi:hypothetical protein
MIDLPMEHFGRAQRIAERLNSGQLAAAASVKLWAGFGNGKDCDGCGDPIGPADVEHEHDLADGGTIRLHAPCSVLWQRMTSK